MRRKSLLYTAFAVMAVAAVIFVLVLQFRTSWVSTSIKEKIRGDELTYLYQDVVSDEERALYIAGKRALIATINYELTNGTFFERVNETVANVSLNGRIDNELQPIMENTTLFDWEEKINNLLKYSNLHANVSPTSIELAPLNQFNLKISADTIILLYDRMLDAKVNRSTVTSSIISLEGLEDPFNTIESVGFILNVFMECEFVNGSIYDESESYGRAYRDYTTTDFSNVDGQEKYVLVTDTIDGKFNYTGFAAIITSEIPSTNVNNPHIFGINDIELIKNESLVVKVGGKLYLTNITYENNNSCYFPWSSAPSILDRLEGRNYPAEKYFVNGTSLGIASFIAIQQFPPELRKVSETHVLDYTYYPL